MKIKENWTVPSAPGIRQCVALNKKSPPQEENYRDGFSTCRWNVCSHGSNRTSHDSSHTCACVFVSVFKVLTFSWLRRLSGRTPRVPSWRHRTDPRNYPASGSPPFYSIAVWKIQTATVGKQITNSKPKDTTSFSSWTLFCQIWQFCVDYGFKIKLKISKLVWVLS